MSEPGEPIYRLKADAAYFQSIEEHFRVLRGTHLFLSPRDNPLIDAWWEAGIPVAVVLRALDSVFRRRREAGDRQPVVSLTYCRHAVEDAFREWQEARLGAGGAPASERAPGPAEAAACLAGFVARLRAADDGAPGGPEIALQEAAAQIEALATRLAGEDPPGLAAAETDLEAVEERLLDRLLGSMGGDARRDLEERAAADLAPLRPRLTARAFEGRLRHRLHAQLRARWGLPALTLYSL